MNTEVLPTKVALAVDIAVFGYADGKLHLLLIERGISPYKGAWALPGGFVRESEDLERAALRELAEETGVEVVYLEQLYTFGAPRRDPRDRVVSVAHFALVKLEAHSPIAGTDAAKARWFEVTELPKLAFDHAEIIEVALHRLRAKVQYEPLAFRLLPREFTLHQLQQFFESVLGRPLDKRNFRKKMLSYGFLKEGPKLRNVSYRSPSLYKFLEASYEKMKKRGEFFSL